MQESIGNIAQWIISHPPLFKACKAPVSDNPFSLCDSFTPPEYQGSLRLGFVYQELCRQMFQFLPGYHVELEEFQVQRGNKTLGAIDFIVRNQEIEHWEVALKFYLLHKGLWFGPEGQDRLDIKLDRMLNHQLAMSSCAEFTQQFPQFSHARKKLLIQGRLYINPFITQTLPDHCLGFKLNPDNCIGRWCYQSQSERIKQKLYILEKLDWLTGKTNPEKLLDISVPLKRTMHCQSGSGEFWMIVPDGWPENSRH